MDNVTMNVSGTEEGFMRSKSSLYFVYVPVMGLILAVGFVGNFLTIVLFSQRQYRTKIFIAPFIINLAIADLFIVLFGYPVVVTANLSGQRLVAETPRCMWSAFINGAIGIASIAILMEISVIMCYCITSKVTVEKIQSRYLYVLVPGPWLYGVLAMIPPLFGWSRFIPGAAGISCCPDWLSTDVQTLAYNLLLMSMGFFVPIVVTLISYVKIYRFLSQDMPDKTSYVHTSRRQTQLRITRVIIIQIVAFLVSWSPYCTVSLIAMFKHSYVVRDGEAEIPELLAKSSVIFNPIIYTIFSKHFRRNMRTLLLSWGDKLLRLSRRGNV